MWAYMLPPMLTEGWPCRPMPACSFHCGSGCHSSEAYQQAVQMARQVSEGQTAGRSSLLVC